VVQLGRCGAAKTGARTRSAPRSLARFLGDYQASSAGRIGDCITVVGRNVVRRVWR